MELFHTDTDYCPVHPNFGGVPVGPDRPCWCHPEICSLQTKTNKRNACCGRETTRCRCKIRYVSKCTAASRGLVSMKAGVDYNQICVHNFTYPAVLFCVFALCENRKRSCRAKEADRTAYDISAEVQNRTADLCTIISS